MTEISLEALLDRIEAAEANELNAIITSVTERFSEVHPDWELHCITVHGHGCNDRREALRKSMELLSHDTKNDLP